MRSIIEGMTIITELLKVKHPFIQAPMLGVTTPQMVASACNEDCVGSLPLGLTKSEKAVELIHTVKSLTSKPFAVNLFVYDPPVVSKDYELRVLKSFYARYNLDFNPNIPSTDPFPHYTELIDILIEQQIPVVSFTFGIPNKEVIERLHKNSAVLMGTATCVHEAKMIEEAGLDVVIAQGIEAGGHRGSFIKGELPQIGLMSLLPQVVDAVKIPVVAAGGLAQARSCAAAFVLGAKAVQMGSVFLRSPESNASKSYKHAVASSSDKSTVLTKAWTGKFARGINNQFIQEAGTDDALPYPLQNAVTQPLRQYGNDQQINDLQALWAGQSAQFAPEKSTGDILKEIVRETYESYGKVIPF